MGIQIESAPPRGHVKNAGPLNLPQGFDPDKWSAYWVEDGPGVTEAGQREWIQGETQLMTADGWDVWKHPETKKPHKVTLGKKIWVLLFRSKSVQNAVNAIYGNVGKKRAMAEKSLQVTPAPDAPANDPGVLSDERLKNIMGRGEVQEGEVVLNKVPDVQRVEADAAIGKEPS